MNFLLIFGWSAFLWNPMALLDHCVPLYDWPLCQFLQIIRVTQFGGSPAWFTFAANKQLCLFCRTCPSPSHTILSCLPVSLLRFIPPPKVIASYQWASNFSSVEVPFATWKWQQDCLLGVGQFVTPKSNFKVCYSAVHCQFCRFSAKVISTFFKHCQMQSRP